MSMIPSPHLGVPWVLLCLAFSFQPILLVIVLSHSRTPPLVDTEPKHVRGGRSLLKATINNIFIFNSSFSLCSRICGQIYYSRLRAFSYSNLLCASFYRNHPCSQQICQTIARQLSVKLWAKIRQFSYLDQYRYQLMKGYRIRLFYLEVPKNTLTIYLNNAKNNSIIIHHIM